MSEDDNAPRLARKSWRQKLGFEIDPPEYTLEQTEKLQKKGYRFTRKTNGMFEVTERIIIAGDDLPKDPREIS